MKNTLSSIKNKFVTRYLHDDFSYDQAKSININVLLNRVEEVKKNESRKKVLFSAAASFGVLLFSFLIF